MATRSVNQVILIGNITRDPEVKQTERGTSLCVFGLATNRSYKTEEGLQEESQFHRIVAWQRLGEQAAQLLKKGRKVYVQGRLVYRQYTDTEQQTRGVCEIVADDFIVLDPKPADMPLADTPADTIADQPTETIDLDELPF